MPRRLDAARSQCGFWRNVGGFHALDSYNWTPSHPSAFPGPASRTNCLFDSSPSLAFFQASVFSRKRRRATSAAYLGLKWTTYCAEEAALGA
jgi:hypothetical protein